MRETEREAETQAEGARCGTRSQDPAVTPWAEGRCSTTEPPRGPSLYFYKANVSYKYPELQGGRVWKRFWQFCFSSLGIAYVSSKLPISVLAWIMVHGRRWAGQAGLGCTLTPTGLPSGGRLLRQHTSAEAARITPDQVPVARASPKGWGSIFMQDRGQGMAPWWPPSPRLVFHIWWSLDVHVIRDKGTSGKMSMVMVQSCV